MVITIDERIKKVIKYLNKGSENSFNDVPIDLTVIANEILTVSPHQFHINPKKIDNYSQIHKDSVEKVNSDLIEKLGNDYDSNTPLWRQVDQFEQNEAYLRNSEFQNYLNQVGLGFLNKVNIETGKKLLSAPDLFEINMDIDSYTQKDGVFEISFNLIPRQLVYIATTLTDVLEDKKTPEKDKKILKNAFEDFNLRYFSFSSAVNLNVDKKNYWVLGKRTSTLGKNMFHSPGAGMITHDSNLSNLSENLIRYEIIPELGLNETNFNSENIKPMAIVSSEISKKCTNIEIIYNLDINLSKKALQSTWKGNKHADSSEHIGKLKLILLQEIPEVLNSAHIGWMYKQDGPNFQILPLSAGAGVALHKRHLLNSA